MKTIPRTLTAGLTAIVMATALAGTSTQVPAEVVAAAPAGTTLLTFKSSGNQANAYAVAVYETAPDQDGVRYRSLIIFGTKDGKLIPEVTSDKLIACSKCSQFHDDPIYGDDLEVTPGHIHIDQMDGGEKPSTTALDFVHRQGKWHVTEATRETVEAGRYQSASKKLPLPKSGLVQDMDARWDVPTYFNGIVVNDTTGKFSFIHGKQSQAAFKESAIRECEGKDCRVVVQQQDGCFSLVRDSSGKSFGAGAPNPKAKADAVSKAMTECTAPDGKGCREIRTDCAKGIR